MNDLQNIEEHPDYIATVEQAKAEKRGYIHPDEHSFSLSGKRLAELLGVAPATLTEAAKKDYYCKDYRVAKWAVRNHKGRIMEYSVPANIYKTLSGNAPRTNPEQSTTVEEDQPQVHTQSGLQKLDYNYENTSLLPPGEDYAKPVGAASAAWVSRGLIDGQTPQARALTVALISGAGAWAGKYIFEDNLAAVIGGLVGLITGYWYIHPDDNRGAQNRNLKAGNTERSNGTVGLGGQVNENGLEKLNLNPN